MENTEFRAASWEASSTGKSITGRAIVFGQRTVLYSDPETGLESLHESIPSAFNLEGLATDNLLIEELKAALRKWKPWAEELLELYLSGAKRSCTSGLCEKYKLSDRAVQKRKAAFEKFVLDFLKK